MKRGDLDPVLINKLVMLRMNKTFMEFLCARKCGGIVLVSILFMELMKLIMKIKTVGLKLNA